MNRSVSELARVSSGCLEPSGYRPNWMRLSLYSVLHIAAVAAPFCYTQDALIASAALYFVCGFGVTLGYHRLLTHRSFQTYSLIRTLLAACGALALLGGPIDWTGKHRRHHALSDKPGDPHSPRDGFWWTQLGWLLMDGAFKPASYTKDLSKSTALRAIERYGWPINVLFAASGFATGEVLFDAGMPWLIWAICVRAVFSIHVAGLVNTIGHGRGPRSFPTPDQSRNVWWVALLTLGEGWHNNHHASQQSAAHGRHWFQFDPTYWVICLMEAVGLAWDVVHPGSKPDAAALARFRTSRNTSE